MNQTGIRIVTIVGGGASGALACANLLAHPTVGPAIQIEWIGNEAPFGYGIAYSTTNPRHLLNVPAGRMSAFEDRPRHFLQWLGENHPEARFGESDFVPRAIYGQYLSQLVDPSHPQVRRHVDEAVAIQRSGSRFLLTLGSGRTVDSDGVILALGNLGSRRRLGTSPWQDWSLPPRARVLLVGTGLTMVDTVLRLAEERPCEPIHAVSPHGLLPHPHQSYLPHVPSEAFRSLLFSSDFELSAGLRIFRRECALAAGRDSDWRAVFDAIRSATPGLWQRMSTPRRKRFLRHLARYWDVHRHRMAPQAADRIAELQRRELLRVRKARVIECRKTDAGYSVSLRLRGSSSIVTEEFAEIIDCTGLITDLERSDSPLLRSLIKERLIEIDEPPIGARPRPEISGLLAIGPLLRGRFFESIAIPELRLQARELAASLTLPK